MAAENCVLVAGATGRAGRLVVKELLNRGYRVRVLMVRPFDAPETSGLSGVEFVEGDLGSVPSLTKAMEGVQYLISALGSKKPFSGKENDKVDNMGNQNLARAARPPDHGLAAGWRSGGSVHGGARRRSQWDHRRRGEDLAARGAAARMDSSRPGRPRP